jgi:nucleoid-associated protein Lsr2
VAQKIQTLFIDDLDGTAAEETVRFGLDGAEYEIDLNAEHIRAIRATLARYTEAARRVAGTRQPARSRRKPAAAGVDNAEVRDWARGQGYGKVVK